MFFRLHQRAVYGWILRIVHNPVAVIHLGVLALGSHAMIGFQACQVPYVFIFIAFCFLAILAIYYLVWKYIVDFVNRVLGIA